MAESLVYSLAVPKEDIYYISWTIDAYEGLGFLRTDDSALGLVSLLFSSDYAEDAESLLRAFEAEGISIKRMGISADS